MKYFPFRGIITQFYANDTFDTRFQYSNTNNIGDKSNGC